MGKASLESIWNENSNELRINPWLTAGFSVLGRGSGVHEEMEKWLERSPENGKWLVTEESSEGFFSERLKIHNFTASGPCDCQANLDYAVETTPTTQA